MKGSQKLSCRGFWSSSKGSQTGCSEGAFRGCPSQKIHVNKCTRAFLGDFCAHLNNPGIVHAKAFLTYFGASVFRRNPKYPPIFGAPPCPWSTPKTVSASKMEIGTFQRGVGDLQSAAFEYRINSEDTMGGVEKRGGRKTSQMTPLPKRGFGPPPRTVRFPPLSGVSALFFLYKNPRQRGPEALLEGRKIFGRARSLVRFPPPIRFAPPP